MGGRIMYEIDLADDEDAAVQPCPVCLKNPSANCGYGETDYLGEFGCTHPDAEELDCDGCIYLACSECLKEEDPKNMEGNMIRPTSLVPVPKLMDKNEAMSAAIDSMENAGIERLYFDDCRDSLVEFSRQKGEYIEDVIRSLPILAQDCPWCLSLGRSIGRGPNCDKCSFGDIKGQCKRKGSKHVNMLKARDAFLESIKELYCEGVPDTITKKLTQS